MKSPFLFDGTVSNQYFTGRTDEISRLAANFTFLTSTLIAAPQGWGKSSLVRRAAETASARDHELRVARMDLFNVRGEEEFQICLAQAIIRAVSRSVEDAIEHISMLLGQLSPKVGVGSGRTEEITIDISWSEIRRYKDIILRLPAKAAEELGVKIIVCIDNFHNIAWFDDPDGFIRNLEDHISRQKNVAYCICGNDGRIMERMAKSFRPISVYGEDMKIGKIRSKEMITFICDKFAETSKYIDKETARYILDAVEEHPGYIQQLAHLSWLQTSVVCTKEIIARSHQTMVDQMSMLFKTLTSTLTNQQLCYLNAILSGERIISTSDVLHRYRITSATSASRSKAALLEKDILTAGAEGISFTDPLYAYWLKHKYFSNSIY